MMSNECAQHSGGTIDNCRIFSKLVVMRAIARFRRFP